MNIKTVNTKTEKTTLGMKNILNRLNNANKNPRYRYYKERLIHNLKRFGAYEEYMGLSDIDKYMVYELRMVINDPVAAPGHVIEKRLLRSFGKTLRSEVRKNSLPYSDTKISIYDLSMVYSFFKVYCSVLEREIALDEETKEEIEAVSETLKTLSKQMNVFLYYTIYNYFASVSDITKEIYYFTLKPSKELEYSMNMSVTLILRLLYQKEYHVKINNNKRPVYRTPYVSLQSGAEWNSIDSSLLGKSYTGEYKKLYLYIQSHALNRISERIDIYENNYSNSLIWNNTSSIKKVIRYKENYLVPFKVLGIKIGYLLAEIVDDKFIITTFLLITHFDTPEGDRFKKVTGLGFSDISYWKLDKLSTFRTFDSEKYPRIADYLVRAGMGDILKLSREHINTRDLQNVDLKQLMNYIIKGHLSDKIQEKNMMQKIQQVQEVWKNQ